jgi:hypothetical protein
MNATVAIPPAVPCLLTAQGGGYYKGKPGLLTLTIHDVKGSTQFNVAKSLVWDITNFPTQVPVTRDCKATSFSFTIEPHKNYHVHLECSQQPSPYEAEATLNEACGQTVATINVINQAPGLVVTA